MAARMFVLFCLCLVLLFVLTPAPLSCVCVLPLLIQPKPVQLWIHVGDFSRDADKASFMWMTKSQRREIS